MSNRQPNPDLVRRWREALALEAKAATMAFPATASGGVGQGFGSAYFDGGMGTWRGSLLPGSQYDYAEEAGDVWMNSAVAACLGWISDNFSEPLLTVERTLTTGDCKPIPGHPFLAALEDPNPDYDADALWQATLLSYLAAGDAFWIKAASPDRSKFYLYYVPHWEIVPRWATDGKTFITDYIHVVDGKRYPLQKSDVVHFRHGLDPRNVRSGLPQLQPVLREICTDNSANTYCAGILRNWGMPNVLITPESDVVTIDKDEADNIKQMWVQRTSGDNIGRPLVNTVGLKIQQLTASPEQMALDKLRHYPEARICAALKIPPTVVGLCVGDGQRTYMNVAADERKAYRNCLIPLQKSFARTLTRQLLPDLGGKPSERVKWDYSTVEAMSEDQDQVSKRVISLYNGGLISQEEARSKVGFGPTKAGETYMTPRGCTLGVSGDVPLGAMPSTVSAPTVNLPGNQALPSKVAAPDAKALPAPEAKCGDDHTCGCGCPDADMTHIGADLDSDADTDHDADTDTDTEVDTDTDLAAKNCGTGYGGFKPGNTCGAHGGGGHGATHPTHAAHVEAGGSLHAGGQEFTPDRLARLQAGAVALGDSIGQKWSLKVDAARNKAESERVTEATAKGRVLVVTSERSIPVPVKEGARTTYFIDNNAIASVQPASMITGDPKARGFVSYRIDPVTHKGASYHFNTEAAATKNAQSWAKENTGPWSKTTSAPVMLEQFLHQEAAERGGRPRPNPTTEVRFRVVVAKDAHVAPAPDGKAMDAPESKSDLDAKNCGTGAGGFKPGNTCQPHGSGGQQGGSKPSASTSALASTPSTVVAPAAHPASPASKFVGQAVGKAEHVFADAQEKAVATAIGGKQLSDNEPLDVRVRKPSGGEHAVEVKSLLKGSKQSISVHDDALLRKVDYAASRSGVTFHTIVMDHRNSYENGAHAANYSGHALYYRRGSGAYSLSTMHRVSSKAELKALIRMPDDQLPPKARGALPSGAAVAKLRVSAAKAHDSRLRKDRARKLRLREASQAAATGANP